MIFDQNVFCFLMHDRILGDANGTSVVTEYGNRLTKFYLKILQILFHPKDLSTQAATAVYSASAVDNEIEVCFFLNHDTRQPPR